MSSKFTASAKTVVYTATAEISLAGGVPGVLMAGSASGVGATTGDLSSATPSAALAGVAAGVGVVEGALSADLPGVVNLEGVASGSGAAAGDLTATAPSAVPLAGVAAGDGVSTGALTATAPTEADLAGSAAGQGAATGDLSASGPSDAALAGTAAGVGSATGDLSTAAAASTISSIQILDATPLDVTNDYGDSAARTGINGNGWVAKAELPYVIGATFDPSKLIFEISSPRWDGVTTTYFTRYVRGTVLLRRQYTANNLVPITNKQQSVSGLTLTVHFALDDIVFAGCSIVSVTAEAGYYGSEAAGSVGGTKTNASTRAYYKALGAFLNMQHDRAVGSGYVVEFSAAHAYGMNGRMVYKVDFVATDASSNTAATQTATTPVLSNIQTQGNICEVYRATIPTTALNQGDICQVNALVYPWIGDSSAVLNLAVDGFAWPTNNPLTPLRFVCDKNETYGGAIAYVKSGASGGVVSRTAATARATPFPTIATASAALATFNNANSTPAHNDHSGSTIYLMDDGSGGAVEHTISASITTASGNCWTDVKVDPLATGAVSLGLSTARGVPDKFRWFVNINQTAGNGFDGGSGGATKMLAFGGGTLNSAAAGAPLNYRNGLTYLSNVTIVASGNRTMLEGFTTTHTQTALALGVIAESQSSDGRVLGFAVMGCRFKRTAIQEVDPASYTTWSSQDGMYLYNNWFRDVRSSGTINVLGNNRAYSIGLALIQNLIEVAGNQRGLGLFADGTAKACDNVLAFHNTIVGGRLNLFYADAAAAAGVLKRGFARFNICNDTWNCKTDSFTGVTTVTGRVGNWETVHNVHNKGNIIAVGSANKSVPEQDGTSWLGQWWPDGTFYVGSIAFTDDKSLPIGTGAMGGAYTLTGASHPAYDQVLTGEAMLAYDQAGVTRRNDDTGASGCFERTV